jgi:crotonobetainyl-CoA:carnitine CoA-transferase CaiB-like acyl-CoA transferase
VPCGQINSIDETFAEPQVNHLCIATKVQHPELGAFEIVGQPINMTSLPWATELRPAPNPGQHTEEILASIGYDPADIIALRRASKV